jgi:hypothetical protein
MPTRAGFSMAKSMWGQKRTLEGLGLDVSHLDAIIKKYGLKDPDNMNIIDTKEMQKLYKLLSEIHPV